MRFNPLAPDSPLIHYGLWSRCRGHPLDLVSEAKPPIRRTGPESLWSRDKSGDAAWKSRDK
ncbi:hypothetical protein ERY430_41273 [Erythrobacter sp. EC-HK427]|nr:hypothetical protein ERY430_41273 [Erythrobacter sp. EC-HK427]